MSAPKAVILVNLGSPAAPEPGAVQRFLAEFLSDGRVVELPALLWQPLLRWVILPLRAKRVAGLYRSIWTENGSPLTATTERQAHLLQHALQQDSSRQWVVKHAMTYGAPSLRAVVGGLRAEGIDEVLVLPLYPQYSGTTTAAVYDRVADIIKASRHVPDIHVVRDYCYRPDYIQALAQSVCDHRSTAGCAGDVLVFSFHGIPQACVDKGDPYLQQCQYTAQAVAERLSLSASEWQICFQSRFGRAKWLQPYTDDVLAGLPQRGVRRIDVICPAFSTDCLETLEEIEMGSRAVFMAAGGEYFGRVPCLNDRMDHIALLRNIVSESDLHR